jgi:hypothetical protein
MAAEDDDPVEVIEACFERGWTDGLPVVPPTEKAMAAQCSSAPDSAPTR